MTTKEKEKVSVASLARLPLPKGEMRVIERCKSDGQIQARDFVPYGLGRGRWHNPCHCVLVSSNARMETLKTIRRKP